MVILVGVNLDPLCRTESFVRRSWYVLNDGLPSGTGGSARSLVSLARVLSDLARVLAGPTFAAFFVSKCDRITIRRTFLVSG